MQCQNANCNVPAPTSQKFVEAPLQLCQFWATQFVTLPTGRESSPTLSGGAQAPKL